MLQHLHVEQIAKTKKHVVYTNETNPGYIMMYIMMFLFFISFIQSKELLIITSISIVIYSIVRQRTLNLFPVIKPVFFFVILMLLPVGIAVVTGNMDFNFRFYIWIAVKVLISSILLGTFVKVNSRDYLINGLLNLGMPSFLNSILALTYRYFYMINNEVKKGNSALVLRGIKNRSFKDQVSILGERVGGFFLKSSDHGEKVYHAMKLRGFDGTREKNFTLTNGMIVRLVISVITLLVILLIDWSFHNGSFFH